MTSLRTSRRSFTLTELLVAMAIIAVIAAVTAVGVRTIARDAKLASAQNTVAAALDTARGLAIRDNRLTVVAFRARPDGPRRQYIEVVTAQWTGESPAITVVFSNGPSTQVIDRFLPVSGIAVRRLPQGIAVAGPFYGSDLDDRWLTPTNLTSPSEAPGSIIGVMYAGDGTVVTRNSIMKSNRLYIDFDGDGLLKWGDGTNQKHNLAPGLSLTEVQYTDLWNHTFPEKECTISVVPFLAVFDDDRCREEHDVSAWTSATVRRNDYSDYINAHADRIHFNRYTGVVMR